MQNKTCTNLLILGGGILFYLLFWSEKQGINLLMFDVFLLGSLGYLYRDVFQSKYVKILTAGTILTVLMVVIHNSAISKIIHFFSFVTLIGFVHREQIVFTAKGLLEGFLELVSGPFKPFRQEAKTTEPAKPKKRGWRRQIKLLPIPIVIFMIFYWVYYSANPKFAELSDQFWGNFDWLWTFDIPIDKIIFFLFGLAISGGVLAKSLRKNNRKPTPENLSRETIKAGVENRTFKTMDLFSEYQTSLLVFYSLCGLLLFVNLIDIRYVWFGFDPEQPQNLKQYVHSGTYLLILAIIMAMVVIIFVFRGNLNYFSKNERLKQLAYLWIGLNVVLAISVDVRNMRYIHFHGLAYKRIGVILFLGLTFYGLYTMFLKVRDKKTLAFLLHKNSWAAYFCLVFACVINWDTFITNYNLNKNTKAEINVPWLLHTTSDKNLFQLIENQDLLKEKESYPKTTALNIDDLLNRKIERFEYKMSRLSWLSWNYSDYRNQRFLENK